MDIDALDVIDKDLNFRDESTNVPSSINGNFSTRMAVDSFYIPKYSKGPIGEDAHFICIESETIGVADGVGGWAKKGIDSGKYLRQLEMMNKSDDPSLAQEIKVPVKIGDVIVMASDGLWDNIHDNELEKLVRDGIVHLCEMGTFSKMLVWKIEKYALQIQKLMFKIFLCPLSFLYDGMEGVAPPKTRSPNFEHGETPGSRRTSPLISIMLCKSRLVELVGSGYQVVIPKKWKGSRS
ncbi:hypothetical protein HAX54_041562 [Datura stramonium]|uniref:Protein phosphatase n=1 Tax=Datura stramonium TaxID=4076 RepID=A0ABS8SLH1_DATST|nr:hypothetical protein [Datura stramonium]